MSVSREQTSGDVVVLINGDRDSAAAMRARGLFGPLRARYEIHCVFRERAKITSAFDFTKALSTHRPDVAYIINTAVSGVTAGLVARLARICPFIVDTGDLGYELAKLVGNPTWPGREGVRATEALAHRFAAGIVVRGTYHKRLLGRAGFRSVHLIRDGVDTVRYDAAPDSTLRAELGLTDKVCVGFMGSLRWSNRLRMCYGWDLVEAMSLIDPSLPIRALVIGDGDGRPFLQKRARDLGVDRRIVFTGSVPPHDLSRYVRLLDIATSTQTNNDVGRVRTTGKLPEYMAAGCYVLASDVGEARLLLPPEMRLPYEGVKDARYPRRLAERIVEVALTPRSSLRPSTEQLRSLARRELDYRVLARRLGEVLSAVVDSAERTSQQG